MLDSGALHRMPFLERTCQCLGTVTISLEFSVPEDCVEKSNIPEVNMICWCEHFMRTLEGRHAGKSTWLQLVCDVFATSPANFGKKVVGWYTQDLLHVSKPLLSSMSVSGQRN